MFLAVLRAKKLKDDESGLLFPLPARHETRDTYPWHQLQLPRPRGIPPKLPVIGQLPREWKWGPDLLPMVLRWHAGLEWLKMPPAHERIPRAHGQVSFTELALDFEAFAGRPLPPAPQSKFVGGDMSLQKKGTVLRLIVTLVGKVIERESIFPIKMTHHCCSLTSMGAGTVMGLEGRPVFTRPTAVWKHLERLHAYREAKLAQQKKHEWRSARPKRRAQPRNRRRGGQEKQRIRRGRDAQQRVERKARRNTLRPEERRFRTGGRRCGRRRQWQASSTHLHTTSNPEWGQIEGNSEAADQVLGLRATWEPPLSDVCADGTTATRRASAYLAHQDTHHCACG